MSQVRRPLCGSELALADQVFGRSLDARRVSILGKEHWVSSAAELIGRGRQVVVRGDTIFAPMRDQGGLPSDFCALGPHMSAFLAHELTHVWQYQSGQMTGFSYALSFNWRYEYRLQPGHRFVDYGYEQQASIVEDYVRLSLGIPARHAVHAVTEHSLSRILPFAR